MADSSNEPSDVTLEAARKQKIHNLKLKTAALENEHLQDLHVSDWSENHPDSPDCACMMPNLCPGFGEGRD